MAFSCDKFGVTDRLAVLQDRRPSCGRQRAGGGQWRHFSTGEAGHGAFGQLWLHQQLECRVCHLSMRERMWQSQQPTWPNDRPETTKHLRLSDRGRRLDWAGSLAGGLRDVGLPASTALFSLAERSSVSPFLPAGYLGTHGSGPGAERDLISSRCYVWIGGGHSSVLAGATFRGPRGKEKAGDAAGFEYGVLRTEYSPRVSSGKGHAPCSTQYSRGLFYTTYHAGMAKLSMTPLRVIVP